MASILPSSSLSQPLRRQSSMFTLHARSVSTVCTCSSSYSSLSQLPRQTLSSSARELPKDASQPRLECPAMESKPMRKIKILTLVSKLSSPTILNSPVFSSPISSDAFSRDKARPPLLQDKGFSSHRRAPTLSLNDDAAFPCSPADKPPLLRPPHTLEPASRLPCHESRWNETIDQVAKDRGRCGCAAK